MKEFLTTFFKSSEERIQNPFVYAFVISWLAFNFQSILVLIFSSKNIEDKLSYINTQHYSISCVLWFPLSSAIFYTLILPHITSITKRLTKNAVKDTHISSSEEKVAIIDSDNDVAIAKLKSEQLKIDYSEANNKNNAIDNLQNTITRLQAQIAEAQSALENERQENFERTNKMNDEYNEMIKKLNSELSDSRSYETDFLNASREYDKVKKELDGVNSEFEKFKDMAIESYKKLEQERDRSRIEFGDLEKMHIEENKERIRLAELVVTLSTDLKSSNEELDKFKFAYLPKNVFVFKDNEVIIKYSLNEEFQYLNVSHGYAMTQNDMEVKLYSEKYTAWSFPSML